MLAVCINTASPIMVAVNVAVIGDAVCEDIDALVAALLRLQAGRGHRELWYCPLRGAENKYRLYGICVLARLTPLRGFSPENL